MSSAIQKFQDAMNNISPFWTKNLEVVAQEGEIVVIKCDGFCFKTDSIDQKKGGPDGKGSQDKTK